MILKLLRGREKTLRECASRTASASYDLLIVGGGASGCGAAVEAARRGLSVCLLERGDYGGQTSSRSTKLVHGGVRYLEKAFFEADIQ